MALANPDLWSGFPRQSCLCASLLSPPSLSTVYLLLFLGWLVGLGGFFFLFGWCLFFFFSLLDVTSVCKDAEKKEFLTIASSFPFSQAFSLFRGRALKQITLTV